ncbi:hypothetical protein [Candidatus Venteria ishoeyi]|uniref:Uncharacterized protein n=1 Tax=Candidatus Venteria ishoeyi TaxID=1899563 RepID=A0A1H6FFH9_9GAMM|nr:hypothetical protein [Candidatus Venteria ishoeyi]SEH07795.1 Uncharacterised protein [Candidatus Venteria ishoeyi]
MNLPDSSINPSAMAYDPQNHPFTLPVQQLLLQCRAEQPFYLPPHAGSTPGTMLAGAFGYALFKSTCRYADTYPFLPGT